jgi:hypothetical protein
MCDVQDVKKIVNLNQEYEASCKRRLLFNQMKERDGKAHQNTLK